MWAIIIYLALTFLSYLYIKRDKKIPRVVRYIVVLSASSSFTTSQRLNTAISLWEPNRRAKIVVCGRDRANYMKDYLQKRNVSGFLVQNKSTNTAEDAKFLKDVLVGQSKLGIVLVSSPTHQRRAYNTFSRFFKNKIWNYPANTFLSFDSVLLPTGWVGVVVNVLKDWKYNGRFY